MAMNPTELQAWFDHIHSILECAYLSHTEPWRQSGQSGPYERWEALRKPIANCIDHAGSFLDIGCANGYLLECCLRWTAERGIAIQPYGLDLSAPLVELAKQRLPAFVENFYVGNSFDWSPPRVFNFVRTELVYVPAEYERDYILRILKTMIAPDGFLLVANYNEGQTDPMRGLLPGSFGTADILAHLTDLRLRPVRHCDGLIAAQNRRVRIAVLDHTSL
jgi:2-polyprenyl-3-methyl-5-hydroxy-6-metoxy-1,4-benzoquinol methylase